MALDVRQNFKCMEPDQQKRFIKAVQRMKTHVATGAVVTGGSYQKYVDWHSDMTLVDITDKKDYSIIISGNIQPSDKFISITIDGKEHAVPVGRTLLLSNKNDFHNFLNTLYTNLIQKVGPTPGGIGQFDEIIAKFKVFDVANGLEVKCENSPYVVQSLKCTINGVSTDFNIEPPVDKGKFQLNNMSVAHFGSLFLPWHRAFIRLFELDLQKADEQVLIEEKGSSTEKDKYIKNKGKLSLPYWDWSVDNSSSANSDKGYLWDVGLMGGTGTKHHPFPGRTAHIYRLENGPFEYRKWIVYERSGASHAITRFPYIVRQIAAVDYSLPKEEHVKYAWSRSQYDIHPFNHISGASSFRNTLEGFIQMPGTKATESLHNVVHGWVGGTMARVPIAPNDPVFFLHHCNVDRIWARWQKKHNRSEQYPAFGPVPGKRLNDEMIPWKSGSPVGAIRAADVLRWQKFPATVRPILGEGYKYDCESTVDFN